MTVTESAVFTFQQYKHDHKRPYAAQYYTVTVFNRKNNKTATIEVPFTQYERMDEFIEDCLYSQLSVTEHCEITMQPKSVSLLERREFYKTQIAILTSINLSIDTLFDEIFFHHHLHKIQEDLDNE